MDSCTGVRPLPDDGNFCPDTPVMPPSLHDLLDHAFDLVLLRELIESGVDLDQVHDESGEPPLVTAARRRRLEAVRALVEAGADVHRPNRHGKTAWAHAVRRGFHEVADYLRGVGADGTLTPADHLAVALWTATSPAPRVS